MSKLVIDNDTMREFYWIRHPKTEVGYTVCYGNTDYKVTEDVLKSTTESVLERLNGFIPEVCYSSPLVRSKSLAEAVFPQNKIITNDLIKEVHFGEWEGIPWEQIPINAQKRWSGDILNFKEHKGENFRDLQQRVIPFWKELLESKYNKVAVVAHAGVIVALLAYLLEADPTKVFRFDIDFGGIIRIRVKGENFIKIKML